MNTKQITAGSLIALLAAGGVAATLSAQTVADETGLTEAQVIELALAEVPGEVQEVELETEDGLQIFEIEILSADGVEMEVEIAALSGEILEIEAEDEDGDDDEDEDDDDEDDGDENEQDDDDKDDA